MTALDIPVTKQLGLRPVLTKGTQDIAPLTAPGTS